MFKALRYFLLLLLLPFSVYGQVNLVPNPSFEIYDTCPNNQNQVQYALGWNSFNATPDYFNSCNSSVYSAGIPYNVAGYQYACSGNAYAGFLAYQKNTPGAREHVGTALSNPLMIGTKYYLSFRVSLSIIDSAIGQTCAVNKIGAKFSTIPYTVGTPVAVDNFAHVYTNSIISDTSGWTQIFGSFIADSSYNYLIIGNFFDDASTNKLIYFNDTTYQGAYYYLDDACVSTDSLFAATWTGISSVTGYGSEINVFPNPFSNSAIIELPTGGNTRYSFILYNSTGTRVYEKNNISSPTFKIEREGLCDGIYIYNILGENNNLYTGKIIIMSN